MAGTLSGSARKVQDALAACGVNCSVIEMPATTRTAKQAAATIGCTVAMHGKIRLRPFPLLAQFPNPATQPSANVVCHP
jgi:hypothetical protein